MSLDWPPPKFAWTGPHPNFSKCWNHIHFARHLGVFRSEGAPVWDSVVFLKSVTYRPTLRKFRVGPVKKNTLFHIFTLQGGVDPAAEDRPCKRDSWGAGVHWSNCRESSDQASRRTGFFDIVIVEDDWIFAEIREKVPDVALPEAHLLFCILPPWQVNIMFHNNNI